MRIHQFYLFLDMSVSFVIAVEIYWWGRLMTCSCTWLCIRYVPITSHGPLLCSIRLKHKSYIWPRFSTYCRAFSLISAAPPIFFQCIGSLPRSPRQISGCPAQSNIQASAPPPPHPKIHNILAQLWCALHRFPMTSGQLPSVAVMSRPRGLNDVAFSSGYS